MSGDKTEFEYDEIGIIGFGSCFDNLSEYYHEENKRLNLTILDKFQEDLDLDIMEWSVHENTHSKILSGDSKSSILAKYKNKIERFF